MAIVGAGVAGLAALRVLDRAGINARVIEARDRIGGRISTVRDPRLPYPIELGAEFIHGSAEEVIDVVGDAELVAYDIEGQRWRTKSGRLTRLDDYWTRLHPVMRNLKSVTTDRSFADFLSDKPGGQSASDARKLARTFVEGFHAADVEHISAKALADGGSPSEDPEEQRIMRIADGYDRIPRWLVRNLENRVATASVVEEIAWGPGAASISVRRNGSANLMSVRARAVIVTIPLGVLLASPGETGAIAFSPPLAVIDDARAHLAMGTVTRVVFLFDERWWTDTLAAAPRDASLDRLSFLHGESREFPIWWTLYPAHLPAMTGWTGGPRALRLAGGSHGDIEACAVASLAKNLGVSRRRVASHLQASWTHDWQTDPYSRGAYSYALVGGAGAAKRLARAVQRTIWIAGEAADAEGRNGTVHGAIGSGRRAAESVLRVLSSSPTRARAPLR